MWAAGKVTSYKGHIQVQIGSSWGKVERINGEEVSSVPDMSHLLPKMPLLLTDG